MPLRIRFHITTQLSCQCTVEVVLLQGEALQIALQLREEEVVRPSQVQAVERLLQHYNRILSLSRYSAPSRAVQTEAMSRPVLADSVHFAAKKDPTFWLFILL